MKTINISIAVKIFDDPEYCDTTNDRNNPPDCPRLDIEGYCRLFFDENGNWEPLEFDFERVGYLKCEECKKAYQMATQEFKQ